MHWKVFCILQTWDLLQTFAVSLGVHEIRASKEISNLLISHIRFFFFLGVLICLPSSKIDGWTLSQRETTSLWKRCQREKLEMSHSFSVRAGMKTESRHLHDSMLFPIFQSLFQCSEKKIIFVPSSSWELTHTLKHSCCSLVGGFRCGDTLGCNRL